MISFNTSGSFDKTMKALTKMSSGGIFDRLDQYGRDGVAALSSATPRDTGNAAESWSYKITKTNEKWSIVWSNSAMAGEVPLVVLLTYGHGTRNGGYVAGQDFINPVIKPIMDRIANDVWKAVTTA